MKKYIACLFIIASLALSSCVTYSSKEINYKEISFSKLQKPDFSVTENLTAEVEVKFDSKGNPIGKDANTYNIGKINDLVPDDFNNYVSYKQPSVLESILSIFTGGSTSGSRNATGILGGSPGNDFALYALATKYPDIDYFVNIRIETKGSLTIVNARGIELRTDK